MHLLLNLLPIYNPSKFINNPKQYL
ncbi:hypothetical protein [Borreliella bissettiae]